MPSIGGSEPNLGFLHGTLSNSGVVRRGLGPPRPSVQCLSDVHLLPDTGARLESHWSRADGDVPQQEIATEPAPALHFGRRSAHRTGLPERRGEMNVKPVRFSR